ncbi:hypothetical protein ACROYT_G042584 [Oculina patagonica]
MGLLYFFETSIEFRAVDPNNLFKRWLDIVEAFIAYPTKTAGVEIKQFWKICGENKLIGVLSVDSPGELDTCFATLLKQQSSDVQITTEVTPFRPYEDFAGTCAERCGESLDTTPIESVTNDGLYYFISSRVEYMGMSQLDLLKIWTEEARTALEAKKKGSILDLWKIIAERQVWVIVCMDSTEQADELLTFDLPILKKMGAQVYTKCKSIRPASCWMEDLKKLVSAE